MNIFSKKNIHGSRRASISMNTPTPPTTTNNQQQQTIIPIPQRITNRASFYDMTQHLSQSTIPRNQSVTSIARQTQTQPKQGTEKKMKWGEPTWQFFHTLAHKMKPEMFPVIKTEFLAVTRTICSNLPCPICSDHAKNYLDTMNILAIQTPEQLKEFFYEFHNTVNKRKNVSVFPREELDTTYENMNVSKIVGNFFIHFQDKTRNNRMMAEAFHRNKAVTYVNKWLSENLQHFTM